VTTGTDPREPRTRAGDEAPPATGVEGQPGPSPSERQLRRQNEYLSALHETTLGLINRLNLEELLEAIITRAARLVDTPHGHCYLVDPAADVMEVKVATEASMQFLGLKRKRGEGVAGKVWETGEPALMDHSAARMAGESRVPPIVFQSSLGMPLMAGPHVAGVMVLGYLEPGRTFGPDEVGLLKRFAQLASLALDNARLFTAERRQALERSLLDQVRTAIASELDLASVFRAVIEAVARAFGYTLVSLYLREGDSLVLQHQIGYARVIERVPLDRGVSGRAVRTGTSVLLEDVRTDPEFLGAIDDIVSEVCVPLFDQGRAVGFLNVESTAGVKLSEADLRLMEAVGQEVGIAIARARLYTEVRESEVRYRSVVESVREVVFQTDAQGTWIFLSPAWAAITGFAPRESVGRTLLEYVDPGSRLAVKEELGELLRGEREWFRGEVPITTKAGAARWFEVRARPTRDPHGTVVGSSGTLDDVTERKLAELLEQDRNQVFARLIKAEPLRGVLTQIALMIERQRPDARCAILLGEDGTLRSGAAPSLPEAFVRAINGTAGGPAAGPLTTVFGRGEPVITIDITRDPRWDAHRPLALTHGLRACWAVPVLSGDGRALGVLTVYFPAPRHPETADLELLEAAARLAAIAIERHQMIEQLAYQAHHDALTGLPNRVVYDDRLQQALARARRAQRLVALFMIDLDRFKQVNDSLGHRIGDLLLRQVGQRLLSCVRASDTLARWGGDEFTAILSDLTNGRDAAPVAEKILAALETPFHAEEHELRVSATIGISLYPTDSQDPEELLRQADRAMYRAGERGRGTFAFFERP